MPKHTEQIRPRPEHGTRLALLTQVFNALFAEQSPDQPRSDPDPARDTTSGDESILPPRSNLG